MYIVGIVLAIIAIFFVCFLVAKRASRSATNQGSTEFSGPNVPSNFKYSGMSVLYYDEGHGNQIEYFDPNGRCYLWYPGNPIALVGHWRVDGEFIYFRYGTFTYNPITHVRGGGWEPAPLNWWALSIVDAGAGDLYNLTTQRVPFELPPHPKFPSVYEVKQEAQ